MKFVHTNIISKNWKALAEFYIKCFECEIIDPIRDLSGEWLSKGTGLQNAKLKGAHLKLPGYPKNGPSLEIYEYENFENTEHLMPNQRGYTHIAFEVDNVVSALERVLENGGIELGSIIEKETPAGYLTFVYVRDPDGNIIELQSWNKLN